MSPVSSRGGIGLTMALLFVAVVTGSTHGEPGGPAPVARTAGAGADLGEGLDVPTALGVAGGSSPTPFYEYELAASLGDGLTALSLYPSIDDNGTVAMIGTAQIRITGVRRRHWPVVLTVDGRGDLTNLTPEGGQLFLGGGVQIGGDGQIAATAFSGTEQAGRLLLVGTDLLLYQPDVPWDFLQALGLWSSDDPENEAGRPWFQYIGAWPSMNNLGQKAFIAANAPTSVPAAGASGVEEILVSELVLATTAGEDFRAGHNRVVLANEQPMTACDEIAPMVADDGRVVVRAGLEEDSPIRVFAYDLADFADIAGTANGFRRLGAKPAISDDGRAVAFYGERDEGPGVFLAIDDGAGFDTEKLLFRVVGENAAEPRPELGVRRAVLSTGPDGLPVLELPPVFFAALDLDSRLGITHVSRGVDGSRDEDGFAGDSVVIAFMGTPSSRSRLNPQVAGSPLLYSQREGLWAVTVDIEALPDTGELRATARSALPVAQVGDVIQGARVDSIRIYDPIAVAATDREGSPRSDQGRADHRIVFGAESSIGPIIVRTTHLDTDGDGLLDHWESDGIDVDGDGAVDLELSRMGANPMHKDVFLELDWSTPRRRGGLEPWRNEPHPDVTDELVRVFREAPVANPDGIEGIELHIDAGPRFSANLPGLLPYQGGDEVYPRGLPGEHIDVVLMQDEPLEIGSLKIESLRDIKRRFFGTTDKNARELAFHYGFIADFSGFLFDDPFVSSVSSATEYSLVSSQPLPDDVEREIVMMTTGSLAGEFREISSQDGDELSLERPFPRAPSPGSDFVIVDGAGGIAEIGLLEDDRSFPGNDFIVSLGSYGVSDGILGSPFDQRNTMAHELGHNLGLKHCGFVSDGDACDEVAGDVSIRHRTLTVSEGLLTASYEISLNAKPSAPVEVDIVSRFGQVETDHDNLTFGTADWARPRLIEVKAVDDGVRDEVSDPEDPREFHGDVIAHVLTSDDVRFAGSGRTLPVRIYDDERPGLIALLGPDDRVEVLEGRVSNVSDDYEVLLTAAPRDDVRVTLTAEDLSGAAAALRLDPPSLLFKPSNWNVPQRITVSPVANERADYSAPEVVHTFASSDPAYNGLRPRQLVSRFEDETPVIVIRQSEGTTEVLEGGPGDRLEIALTQRPTSDVVVKLTTGSEVRLPLDEFTFSDTDWDEFQYVAVQAVDDDQDGEGFHTDTVTARAQSSDPVYDGLSADGVPVFVGDDDLELEPDHRSLMSYAHVHARDLEPLESYAGGDDPLLDEWNRLLPDFFKAFAHLGTSEPAHETSDISLRRFVELYGHRPDVEGPELSVRAPARAVRLPVTSGLRVRVAARDVSPIAEVSVGFDTDGDGSWGEGETITATEISPGVYQALVPGASGATGSRPLLVRAEDVAGNFTLAELSVDVVPEAENQPPVALDDLVTTGVSEPVAVTLRATDPNGSPLTYAIVTPPAGGSLTGTPPDLSYAPAPDFTGFDELVFQASDGLADSGPATVTLMVGAANAPPELLPVAPIAVDEGRTLEVAIAATDADGDAITLSARGLPGFASFRDDGAGIASLGLAPGLDDVGRYLVEVTASDALFTSRADIELTVNLLNEAPLLAPIGDLEGFRPFTIQIPVSASDPDGDELTFSAAGLPPFARLLTGTGRRATLELSPAGLADTGEFPGVTISVSDGALSDSETLTIRVAGDEGPPELQRVSPADGATHLIGLGRIQLIFSERLDAATVAAGDFQLSDAGGSPVPIRELQLREFDRQVLLGVDPLAAGRYALTVDAGGIADLAGNRMGDGPLVATRFTVVERTASFGSLFPDRVYETVRGPQRVVAADLDLDGVPDLVVTGLAAETSVLLGNGDGSFAEKADFFGAAHDVAVGDVNGDGHLDLVTGSGDNVTGTVAVRLGNGDGGFGDRIEGTAVIPDPEALALGDMDGDGVLDVVAVARSSAIVLRGAGDGTFPTALGSSTSAGNRLALGDVNGDGHLDVVAQLPGFTAVSVVLGSGGGTFAGSASYFLAGAVEAVGLGDADGDGDLDIAAASWLASPEPRGAVEVLRNDGSGSFDGPVSVALGAAEPRSVALGDLNGDGALDIAASLFEARVDGRVDEANAVAVALGNGDGSFAAAARYPAGARPSSLAVADFDRDGDADLAAANLTGSNLSVLLNEGDGRFPVQPDIAAGFEPISVASGDVDGDGNQDVAVLNAGGLEPAGSVSLQLGNGDGTFTPASSFAVGVFPQFVALRDLEGDGALDLVVANGSASVSVLLGRGDGSFDPRVDYADGVGFRGVSIDFGDIDGDGDLDMAVATPGSNSVSILMGRGDGGFGPGLPVDSLAAMSGVALGDVDGDGDLDLVAKHESSARIELLAGNGDGTFARPPASFDAGTQGGAVSARDVDGDGDLDIVTGSLNAISFDGRHVVSVLLGSGDGTFAEHVDYLVGDRPVGLALGRVNDDDHLDVVTANAGEDSVSVLLGVGDGSFTDRTSYDVASEPRSVTLGDWNGDGRLDFATANLGGANSGILPGTVSPRLQLGGGAAAGLPVAEAGPDQTVALGSLVRLDGGASRGADSSPALEFLWRQTGGRDLEISGSAAATASLLPVELGTYRFDLTVTAEGVSDTDTVEVTVVGAPDLVLTSRGGPKAVLPGEPATYTLALSNEGNVAASGVVLVDRLPPSTRFVAASDGGTASADQVTWPPAALAPGQTLTRTLTVQVDSAVPSGLASITNVASASDDGAHGADPTPGDNVVEDTSEVVAAPDLAVTLDDGRTRVLPGETLTYQLSVANLGTQGAAGVVLRQELSPASVFVAASDGGAVAGDVVSWPPVDLPAGGSLPRSVIVKLEHVWPPDLDVVESSASVSDGGSDGSDLRPANNVAVDVGTVALPDLVVSIDDGETLVAPGQTLSYAIRVTNAGREIATGVSLANALPPESLFVAASDGGGLFDGSVGWPPFELPPGSSQTRTVTVELVDPWPAGIEEVVSTVFVKDDGSHGPDPSPESDVAEDRDRLSIPTDLALTMDASPDPAALGQQLTYTIQVVNRGPELAADVALSDRLPAQVTLISATASQGECRGVLTLLCSLGDLAVAETVEVTVVVAAARVGSVTNVVTASSEGLDLDEGDNWARLTTEITETVDEWSFTDATALSGLATPGVKSGGLAWCDLNQDGYLDALVNAGTASQPGQSHLYFNAGDGTFTEVTATHAAGLARTRGRLSAICADLNGDGAIDFARNDHGRVEVYLNRGPLAAPAFSFGDAGQGPSQVLTDVPGGLNTEGMGFIDYDRDGDIDLVVDNHDRGIDLFRNDGSGRLEHATPDDQPRGLPTEASSGDYLAVADYDGDGWVDVLGRKEDQLDLWRNRGDGGFEANPSLEEQARDGDEGGVAFCDLDSDGDLDVVWTDAGETRIWRNRAGLFEPTAEPSASSGRALGSENIDGVACADVDNDGDLDLFLGAASGESHLFLNETTPGPDAALRFFRDNHGIDVDGDAEGLAFGDHDRDGDLDLLVNVNGGANQLWESHRNDAGGDDYLVVRALTCLGTGLYRDDIGATVRLFDAGGTEAVSPAQEVNGGRGHGSQNPPRVHFGLPGGPDRTYMVQVQFLGEGGLSGPLVRRTVVPRELGAYQILSVKSCGEPNQRPVASDLSFVVDADEPVAVELLALDPEGEPLSYEIVSAPAAGTLAGAGRFLSYTPGAGFYGDSFSYRAHDGELFSEIATVRLETPPPPFEEAGPSLGLGVDGSKEGGLAWCDFDDDGDLDVLVNAREHSRLLFNEAGSFRDVTGSHAPGLALAAAPRSAICADLDNDGHLDLARNGARLIEVYLNRGPRAKPPWSFGRKKGRSPDQVVRSMKGGMNVEGMGFLDFDRDGDLDLVVDNHDYGIDLFRNDGRGSFHHITRRDKTRGLPRHATSGDYLAVADFDRDGWVDLLDRKQGQLDLWRNLGDGTFRAEPSFDEEAEDRNKGGAAFCDVDADGDFDLLWTDAGASQIWRNDGGSFSPTGEPARSAGVDLGAENLDGVACADVDHDGDLDLFFAAAGGTSYLFSNQTPAGSDSTLSFAWRPGSVDVQADGEAAAFGDYDRDGDQDLLVNVDGGPNQLWRNGADNSDYLVVRALRCLSHADDDDDSSDDDSSDDDSSDDDSSDDDSSDDDSDDDDDGDGGREGRHRDDVGATVRLFDGDGTTLLGPVQEVNGGRGHGSQSPAYLHFGLPLGPNRTYVVEVSFVGGPVVREVVRPSTLGDYQLVTVRSCATAEDLPGTPSPDVQARESDSRDPVAAPRNADWIRYGDPEATAVRVVSRTARRAVLELTTGGFYALPQPDRSVQLYIPGFDPLDSPGAPDLPVRRTWLDAVAGQRVRIGQARALDIESFPSLRPSDAGVPEAVVFPDGTVRAGRRAARQRVRSQEIFPAQPAMLLDVGFQGELKKALVQLAPLRWDAASGRLLLARRLEITVSFAGKEPGERPLGGARGRKGGTSGRPIDAAQVVAFLSAHGAGPYAVSFEELFPGRRRALRTTSLRLARRGLDVPFRVVPDSQRFGPGSTLYFLSQGAADNPNASEAVYALESGVGGATMDVRNANPSGPPLRAARVRRVHETDRLYVPALLDAPDPWLWDVVSAAGSRSYPFALDRVASGAPGRLLLDLVADTDTPEVPDQRVRMSVNGVLLADVRWDGERPFSADAAIPGGVLHDGTNTLRIHGVGDTGASVSRVYLDRFAVEYSRALVVDTGSVEATFDASGQAIITGLAADAVLFDTTDPEAPAWIAGARRNGTDLALRAEAGRRIFAASPAAVLRPAVRLPERVAALRDTQTRYDYVAMGPRDFLEAAQPLLQWRRNQGLAVLDAPLQDIYDSFSGGEPHSGAIHDFLAFAFHHWPAPPRYVLLLGDASYDGKGRLGLPDRNHVPPLMRRTPYMWTVSDAAYAAVNGDDRIPDLAIGRLPAASADEARRLALKVLAWERDGYRFDDATAVFVADDADGTGDFTRDAEHLARTHLAGRDIALLRLDQLGGAAGTAVRNALDRGAGVVSFSGHGSFAHWASGNVLASDDLASLERQPRLPLLLTVNCLNGYILHPVVDSLSEAFLKADGKGAVAAFSAATLSTQSGARRYRDTLLEEVLSGRHARLGDALLAAQARSATEGALPDLLDSYLLLADPATSLR